ncbi:hypothetical protein O0L34_g9798 [Tuta absoluta]|nr:hypothetical protein O0L34_g9797 [Tuta absoluta]KAJ2948006.1 hypothetical protein O0L34_g9798 [Tuta absoluta]
MAVFQLVVVFSLAIAAVSARPTHCERWKGDKEFRCAKDNYHADRVKVRNITGNGVSFKVGKWISSCGRPGTNYSDRQYTLNGGESTDVDFGEVGPGACNELFIYDCKRDGRSTNCVDVVTPSVP